MNDRRSSHMQEEDATAGSHREQVATLRWVLIAISVVGSIVGIVSWTFLSLPLTHLALNAWIILTGIIGLWVLNRGRFRAAAWMVITAFWMAALEVGWVEGLDSSTGLMMLLAIVLSGLLLGPFPPIVVGTIMMVSVGLLYVVVPYPPLVQLERNDHAVGLVAVMLVTTFLVSASSRDLHRAIARSRRSEKYRRRLFWEAPDPILVLDSDGAVQDANRAAVRLLETERDALLHKPFGQAAHLDSHGLDVLARQLREAKSGGSSPLVTLDIVSTKGVRRVVDCHAQTLSNPEGERLTQIVLRDVTEQHHLEERLRHAQKMEAVGRLAGGIAHDFNNFLTVILANARALQMQQDVSTAMHAGALADIIDAANHSAALTRQLLAFGRKQPLNPKAIDLNDLVHRMDRLLRRVLGEAIEIETRLAEGLGRVRMDPTQLEQVVLNLAINAHDAMPKGGKLTIETRSSILGDDDVAKKPGLTTGHFVVLVISDSGVGMDEETMGQIFEPFFTTKKTGSGLGLSTVWGIVTQANGSISVHSEPGHGTTFRIHLPVSLEEADFGPAPKGQGEVRGGSETILLVEDEEAVRRVTARTLRGAGYRVIEAGNGEEATRRLEEVGHRIDLLVTDIVMPKQTGPDLAKDLRERWPELDVVYISGYAAGALDHNGHVDSSDDIVEKPFKTEDLLLAVRRALETTTPRKPPR